MATRQTDGKKGTDENRPAPSRMVLAVLSTLFCCLPGVVAIVYAARTNTCNEQKDFKNAWENARVANVWSLVALGFGAACLMIVALMAAAILPHFVRPESPHDRAAIQSLENLAEAQDIHFEVHGAYASDINELDYVPEEDVWVEIKYGDDVSWRAVAQHYESEDEIVWDSDEGGLQRPPLIQWPSSDRDRDD